MKVRMESHAIDVGAPIDGLNKPLALGVVERCVLPEDTPVSIVDEPVHFARRPEDHTLRFVERHVANVVVRISLRLRYVNGVQRKSPRGRGLACGWRLEAGEFVVEDSVFVHGRLLQLNSWPIGHESTLT